MATTTTTRTPDLVAKRRRTHVPMPVRPFPGLRPDAAPAVLAAAAATPSVNASAGDASCKSQSHPPHTHAQVVAEAVAAAAKEEHQYRVQRRVDDDGNAFLPIPPRRGLDTATTVRAFLPKHSLDRGFWPSAPVCYVVRRRDNPGYSDDDTLEVFATVYPSQEDHDNGTNPHSMFWWVKRAEVQLMVREFWRYDAEAACCADGADPRVVVARRHAENLLDWQALEADRARSVTLAATERVRALAALREQQRQEKEQQLRQAQLAAASGKAQRPNVRSWASRLKQFWKARKQQASCKERAASS